MIGAGAAGLMAARELARAGKKVTILEARDRCGGRILVLPSADFGYPAEGGPEFVHGEAPVTRALLHEAGLSLQPVRGTRWTVENGTFSPGRAPDPGSDRFYRALAELKADLPIAEFLKQHFAGPEYARLRRSIERMAEGYDAADPARASAFALRDEWMNEGPGNQGRIAGGYGALIDFLAAECRALGAVIHLNAVVKAIEIAAGSVVVRCASGEAHAGAAAILTVPLPLLEEIELPPAIREKAAATADIGFGNVIKLLLRFKTRWWAEQRRDLADLSFLISDRQIPVWWTQSEVADPVLTGWFGGPKTKALGGYDEAQADRDRACLAWRGLRSLAEPVERWPGRRACDQLGQRSIFTRSLFLRDARNARGAVATCIFGRRPGVLLRRGALSRAGYGHGRGSAGQRPGNSANHPGCGYDANVIAGARGDDGVAISSAP